jgi:hypothetical protein
MPSFEIPDGPTSISLKNDVVKGQVTRTGSANFSVTNKSGQPLAGRLSVQPQGDAKAEWFDIMGEKERNFAPTETQKITVNIKTPPAAKMGDYKFRFRAVNVNDPDNDYTDSAVVTFNLVAPPPPVPPKFPWWAVAVGVVLFLVVIGVVIWLVIPKGVAVPDVSTAGLTYDAAAKQVTDAGLNPKQNPTPATSGAPGTVVSQNPAAGATVDKGSDVTLTIAEAAAAPTITVPDVTSQGISFDTAIGILSVSHLNAVRKDVAPQGKTPGTVVGQDPPANAQVPATTKDVTLSVDPGVEVPDARNSKTENGVQLLVTAGLQLAPFKYQYLDNVTQSTVVNQDPLPTSQTNRNAAKDSKVQLTVTEQDTCRANRRFCLVSSSLVAHLIHQ